MRIVILAPEFLNVRNDEGSYIKEETISLQVKTPKRSIILKAIHGENTPIISISLDGRKQRGISDKYTNNTK